MKTYKYFSVIVILALLIAALPVSVVNAAGTTVVMPSDVGVSWLTSDTRAGGSSSFVVGPNSPPAGVGSIQFTTTDTAGGPGQAKAQLFNYQYGSLGVSGDGVALADIDEMSYWTYRASASTNSAAQTISLNMEVDFLGDGLSYTTLVFEPIYNPSQGAMALDTWQKWDAFDSGNAVWWSTKAIPGVCAFNCFVPWSTILANIPDAEIIAAFGFNVGSGWSGDFEGYADALTFGVAGDSTTYDFEPVIPCTSICYADVNSGNDANGGSSPLDSKKTIQAAINQVDPGGTVIVAAGTYNENLDIAKPLTIDGAGSGTDPMVDTIIDPSGGLHGIYMHQPANLIDLRVTGAPLDGIRVYKPVGELRLDFVNVTWQNIASSGNAGKGVEVHNDTDVSNLTIINSEFIGNAGQGLRTASNVTVDGLTITDSLFSQNSYGIYLQGTINNLNILGSSVNDSTNGHGAYLSETGPVTNMVIEDSEFNNNYYGLVFYNTQDNSNITISRTDFQGNDKSGVWMYGNTLTNVLIQESNILNNDVLESGAYGIDIGVYGGVMNNVAVHYSNIIGHSFGGGLLNGIGSETAQVDGTCNWWGAADGPSGSGSGSGDAVTDYVTFTPWLVSAAPDGSCTGMPDTEGPITTNLVANSNPAAVGSSVTITANVDDTNKGDSEIISAEYSLDGGTTWNQMDALDGIFNEVSEDVTASFTAPLEPGIYDLCVYGTDAAGNSGPEECIMFVVYDPSGGFVTGGGWIDSPAGAFSQSLPVQISGDTALISFMGGYTGYMYRNLDAVCDPNSAPVTFSGTLDVSSMQNNSADLFGLVDKEWIDGGGHAFQTGAYLYVGRRGDNLIIGPSDGNAGGGELVQTFKTFTDYFASGTPSPLSVAVEIYNSTVTVSVTGTDYADDYGTVVATTAWAEFEYGAYIGIDSWPSTNSILYDLTIDGCSIAPTGKATFGFVSKYKKGASVPEGNTQFQFQAGGLNFQSTSYEWLVVNQGGANAQFKGYGTINGAGNYGFMLWAGDGSPDTFRIRIWEADTEVDVYDNGPDQAIGGGSVVVHKAK